MTAASGGLFRASQIRRYSHVSGDMIEGKYSVELITGYGEGGGLREVLYRHNNLALARALYKGCVERYSGQVIVLYDRARELARSDRS